MTQSASSITLASLSTTLTTSLRGCTVFGETGVDVMQVVFDDAAVHRVHAPRVVRQTGD